jgi:hypothetical protein
MHLIRCKDQKRQTLDEFYSELGRSDRFVDQNIGGAMLDLIARLRALPGEQQLFGLTSHYRLCLLDEDDYTAPWRVIISAVDRRDYSIQYLMPVRLAPWPNASVRGEARSIEAAVEMIIIAMEKSEGWVQKA